MVQGESAIWTSSAGWFVLSDWTPSHICGQPATASASSADWPPHVWVGSGWAPRLQHPAGKPGCVHRVTVAFQEEEEDTRLLKEWTQDFGDKDNPTIWLAAANHRLRPCSQDGETDGDFAGGALQREKSHFCNPLRRSARNKWCPQPLHLVGPERGWGTGPDLESYAFFNLKH